MALWKSCVPLIPALLLASVLSALLTSADGLATSRGKRESTSMTTSESNEYYLGFLRNYVKPTFRTLTLNKTSLYITTSEPTGATVTITFGDTQTVLSLTPDNTALPMALQRWEPPEGVRVQGSWDRNKGIRVKADQDKKISVFTLNEEIHSVEGFTALPCLSYPGIQQYVYYAISVPSSNATSASEADSVFLIVACSNDTLLNITPTQNISDPDNTNIEISAGENFSFELQELETLYIHSQFDLTGSKVTANKPVTFISGHECGNVPYNVLECDHLVEQIPPTITWGQHFLTAPTADQTVGDVFKILAAEDETSIQISCTSDTIRSFSLNIAKAGRSKNFTLTNLEYCNIVANKRILVVKFIPGFYFANAYDGDPFMVQIPAMTQYVNEMTIAPAIGFGLYFDNYLNVFVPETHFDPNLIKIDGEAFETDWTAIPCASDTSSTCGRATQFASVRSNTHHIVNEMPGGTLGVTVYGTSYLETYAYVGGLNLIPDVPVPMLVEPQQTSFIVLSSDSLCLRCELANSDFAPSIEWTFESSSILPTNAQQLISDDGSLCITNATFDNNGNYTCTAGSSMLSFTVTVIAGIIIQAPTCRPSPTSNDTVLLGIGSGDTTYIDISTTALEICCRTQGALGSIQWLADSLEISVADSSYEIGDGFLKAFGPFQEECVMYTCSALFDGVETAVSATAQVCAGEISPPRTVTIAGEVKVIEGESASLTCSSDGYPEPMKIWSLASGVLPGNAFANEQGSLVVGNMQEGDGTMYCCDVGNSHGTASSCAIIEILVPPEIQQPVIMSAVITKTVSFPPPDPTALLQRDKGTADIGQIVMILEHFDLRMDCVISRGNPTPVISWFKNSSLLSNTSHYKLFPNGSFLIEGVTTGRDDSIFTCRAESDIGYHELNSSITVIVAPVIAEPGPPFTSPGNCQDTTESSTASHQVGSGLCIRAGPGTQFKLSCLIDRGFPPPLITWYKDGEPVNVSSLEGVSVLPEDSLLIENISLTIEALAGGHRDLSGLYTCSAENIAGVANASSYIIPFGNISTEAVSTYFKPLHLQLFHQLFSDIAEHMEPLANDEQHLALLGTGKLLSYDDYYPGRDFDGSEETIPPVTLEKMFTLVDVIPDASSLVAELDYETESLAGVYKSLVRSLQVVDDEANETLLQAAREYLQTVVDDSGSLSDASLPRLSLYLLYKNRYYLKKLEVETKIDAQRNRLFGRHFSDWYDKEANLLQSEIEDAFMKWTVFGGKDEIEKHISVLNLEDFSEPLDEARSLLIATQKRSKVRDDAIYHPVEFVPGHWFDLLKNCIDESIEQMQYHAAKLKAQKEILEITRTFLEAEASCGQSELFIPVISLCPQDQYTNDPTSVYNQLDGIRYFMEHEVQISERSRYKCLITRNPIDCQLYRFEYEVVKELMEVYADLYLQVQFVRTATNHREVSIPSLSSAIRSLALKLERIGYIIQVEVIESSSRVQNGEMFKKIPTANRIDNFKFSTMDRTQEHEFELPSSVGKRLLWYFNEKSTRFIDKGTLDEYNETFNHLNTLHTNVSAKLIRIDVYRRWFKPSVLANSHLKLTDSDGDMVYVSPGLVQPSEDFQSTIKNGSYQLPVYPTSLILATDIKLSINTPFPFHTLPRLLKISYDKHLFGGFGPFKFGQLFQSHIQAFKFRIEVHGNDVVLTLPGTQLIGYLCNIVPRSPSGTHENIRRRRRSVFDDAANEHFVEFAEFHSPLTNFDRWLLKNDRGTNRDNSVTINERNGDDKRTESMMKQNSKNAGKGSIVPTSTPLVASSNSSSNGIVEE